MPVYENRYYYLGPWDLKTEIDYISGEETFSRTYYDAPDHTVGRIDMRPVSDITEAYGFFSTDTPLKNSDYIDLGSDLYGDLTEVQLDAWKTALNMKSVDGVKLIDVLWSSLTSDADPEGGERALPIMPTYTGDLDLHLGGHSLIHSRAFEGEKDKIWKVIQKALHDQYKQLDKDLKDSKKKEVDENLVSKVLGAWKIKYKISDEGLFIPAGTEKLKAKDPTTTVSDSFNRSNESLDAGNWNETDGGWSIVSNRVKRDGLGATFPAAARYTTALSTDDHYGRIYNTYLSTTTSFVGPAARCSSSAKTFYGAYSRESGTRSLNKCIAGTYSGLWSDSSGDNEVYIKVEANGSTIKYYYADSEVSAATTTDTSITGNLYAGIIAHSTASNCYGDVFSGEDLVVLPLLPIFGNQNLQYRTTTSNTLLRR